MTANNNQPNGQPQSLADAFGVKIADADAMLEEVAARAYVDKMASFGYPVSNDQELTDLLDLGRSVAEIQDKQAQADANNSVYKQANEFVRQSVGLESPEAYHSQMQTYQAAEQKTAQYAGHPDVIAHLLARNEFLADAS